MSQTFAICRARSEKLIDNEINYFRLNDDTTEVILELNENETMLIMCLSKIYSSDECMENQFELRFVEV